MNTNNAGASPTYPPHVYNSDDARVARALADNAAKFARGTARFVPLTQGPQLAAAMRASVRESDAVLIDSLTRSPEPWRLQRFPYPSVAGMVLAFVANRFGNLNNSRAALTGALQSEPGLPDNETFATWPEATVVFDRVAREVDGLLRLGNMHGVWTAQVRVERLAESLGVDFPGMVELFRKIENHLKHA